MLYKQIHIKVPAEIYEAFYRKHPGRGERTKFLLEKICEDIETTEGGESCDLSCSVGEFDLS